MGDQKDFVAYEFEAAQAWDRRDYSAAIKSAAAGVELALAEGSAEGAARLLLLRARSEFEAGRYQDVLNSVGDLAGMQGTDYRVVVQSKKLKALVLQGMGKMEEAVELARRTIEDVPAGSDGIRQSMDLHWVLIAALAESGRLEEAWSSALSLAELASRSSDRQASGKSYWTIGNVAFMTGRNDEAVHFHALASEALSKERDVNGWGLFNKGSAHMRLMAELATDETLDCIERAELAISVTGGSPRDEFEVALLRAHWEILVNEPDKAVRRLEELPVDDRMPEVVLAEYSYLRGMAAEKTGEMQIARQCALACVEVFRSAGLEARLRKAEELLDRTAEIPS